MIEIRTPVRAAGRHDGRSSWSASSQPKAPSDSSRGGRFGQPIASRRGQSLTAWRCADQAQAARIAMGQLARWVRLGLGVSVTMAGARTEAAGQGGMPQEAAA